MVLADGWAKKASYGKAEAFNFCKPWLPMFCSMEVGIYLSTSTVKRGDRITIYDSKSGKKIKKFRVKGIYFENATRKCWLTDKSGESRNYITVSGCQPLQ